MEECIDFAVETGFMTAEEAEKIKEEGSMGFKEDDGQEDDFDGEKDEFDSEDSFSGPGGCTSEEECMEYCSDPAYLEECAAFRGGQRVDEFDQSDVESDETIDQEVLDQESPSEFEDQDQIDEGFDYIDEGFDYDESPDDSEMYEYEGDEYRENEIYYDDEGSGFEGLDSQDIPLDLDGDEDEDGDYPDAIDVNPEPFDSESSGSESNENDQGDGESSGDGGESSSGGTDAGLMKSVKQFFSRVVSFLVI